MYIPYNTINIKFKNKERGEYFMAKGRAENKVLFTMWIDKDLKAQFKELTKCNMSKVLTNFIVEYIEENSEEQTGAD